MTLLLAALFQRCRAEGKCLKRTWLRMGRQGLPCTKHEDEQAMAAGKQVCPGEAILARGGTTLQWPLADLCCGINLFDHGHPCSAKGYFHLPSPSPPFTPCPGTVTDIQGAATSAGPAVISSSTWQAGDIRGDILAVEADGALAREDEPPAAGAQTSALGKEG